MGRSWSTRHRSSAFLEVSGLLKFDRRRRDEAVASARDMDRMSLDDSMWARGKCAYMLGQYGPAMLPAVASAVAAAADVTQHLGYARRRGKATGSTSCWIILGPTWASRLIERVTGHPDNGTPMLHTVASVTSR